jgi:hypothetical protein
MLRKERYAEPVAAGLGRLVKIVKSRSNPAIIYKVGDVQSIQIVDVPVGIIDLPAPAAGLDYAGRKLPTL